MRSTFSGVCLGDTEISVYCGAAVWDFIFPPRRVKWLWSSMPEKNGLADQLEIVSLQGDLIWNAACSESAGCNFCCSSLSLWQSISILMDGAVFAMPEWTSSLQTSSFKQLAPVSSEWLGIIFCGCLMISWSNPALDLMKFSPWFDRLSFLKVGVALNGWITKTLNVALCFLLVQILNAAEQRPLGHQYQKMVIATVST